MSRINVLDQKTANAIKAGEVIERPVSVVKELVDNSIDACATSVKIEFDNGGISLIRVSDNGFGMDREDAEKCFLLNATSKIKTIDDIYDLTTQGFRGEALASIAACSDITVVTKMEDMKTGTCIEYEDGRLKGISEVAADTGTVVTVKNLFANIPARYKFLKRDATESMYICSLVEKLAIINPQVAFKLIKDGKQILSTPGNGNMKDAIYAIYGKELTASLVEINYELDGIKIKGFAANPSYVRGNRGMQYVYVNDRPIKSAVATAAIDEAYKASVMKHKYPVCVLCIYIPAGGVDVNVHPQKAEVKFSDDSIIFRLVLHGIRNAVFAQESVVLSAPSVEKPVAEATPVATAVSKPHTLGSRQPERSTYTQADAGATDNLLRILSEFKPDVSKIENEDKPEEPEEENIIEEPATDRSDIDELYASEFVGFLFSTYIIMQSDHDVFLVDQHAAHERVLYERFGKKREAMDETQRSVQELLIPQIIDLSTADMSFVTDNIDRFKQFGFDVDIAGDRQVALRAVPIATKAEDRLKKMSKPEVFFTQVLEDLKRETPAKSQMWISLIQTTACKAAIKAHDVITKEEALSLISQLHECNDPYHCAHGRPTFIKIPETDMEKRFKRIV
ncbi:MAG: DNA mismatch repair endonuclease MutL [Clostridiales bacterium]|nr:DNA mismatch repair endonuclease MutL [Clostridiales bacterium]MBP3811456.1 DNA mismatch repair endonuclease MutL [Clostridiales bacterium]